MLTERSHHAFERANLNSPYFVIRGGFGQRFRKYSNALKLSLSILARDPQSFPKIDRIEPMPNVLEFDVSSDQFAGDCHFDKHWENQFDDEEKAIESLVADLQEYLKKELSLRRAQRTFEDAQRKVNASIKIPCKYEVLWNKDRRDFEVKVTDHPFVLYLDRIKEIASRE